MIPFRNYKIALEYLLYNWDFFKFCAIHFFLLDSIYISNTDCTPNISGYGTDLKKNRLLAPFWSENNTTVMAELQQNSYGVLYHTRLIANLLLSKHILRDLHVYDLSHTHTHAYIHLYILYIYLYIYTRLHIYPRITIHLHIVTS